MALTRDEREKLNNTHDAVIRIETVLGNGDKGICHDVSSLKKKVWRVEIIIALVIGSGILGGGAWGLRELLLR